MQYLRIHYWAIDSCGYRTLKENQKIEYTVRQGPKGLQAAQVHRGLTTSAHRRARARWARRAADAFRADLFNQEDKVDR